jgi:acyl-CoA thioesterase I
MISRKFLLAVLVGAFLCSRHSFAADQAPSSGVRYEVPCPFWYSSTMEGESVLFVQGDGNDSARASLLFQPTRILQVSSSSGEVIYAEGRDFTWNLDTKEIKLPHGSRIVFKTPKDLRRPANSQPYALTHRDGKGEILFGRGHEYHDMQTVVTYEHARGAWTGTVPSYAGDQLPRTIKKLSAKKSLTVALLGDSISAGCNASGWAKTPPFQPPYQDLFVRNLEATYKARVILKNFAVGGTDTAGGVASIGEVIKAAPDLVILAFGMNDSARRPAQEFRANTLHMVDAVQKAHPSCEFILVAGMVGNADWTALQQERFPQYRDALADLTRPGVALADLTSIWIEMLKHKRYWDLTGNGVNHPKDFGHSIYAQVLSSMLIQFSCGQK